MNWPWVFNFANGLALAMWIALIFLPRWQFLRTTIFYLGTGFLCLVYAVLVALMLGGVLRGAASHVDMGTIAGVRAIFRSDGGVVLGWIHYLAFDLFVGQWIARDADDKGFSRVLQAPVLALTFILGPAGLALWLIIRDRTARRRARSGSIA